MSRIKLHFLAWFVVLCAAAAQDQEPQPPIASFADNGSQFYKPRFATVNDFVTSVQVGKAPWRKLFASNPNAEFGRYEETSEYIPDSVTIVHSTEDSAVVFVRRKQGRTLPLCIVIFLLEKNGKIWRVSNFTRHSERFENGADAGPPQTLRLQPSDAVHFYFTIYSGSHKWGFDTDRFYMVRNGKIQPTLTLKNISAYLSPADPYREFTQSAAVGAAHGAPRLVIHRVWGIEGGHSRRQEFPVAFQWDAQAERFISPDAERATVREPKLWTGGGLPKPPGE